MTPRPAPHVIRWFLRTFGYGYRNNPLEVEAREAER
jgi:hypothetical protein